MIHGFEKETHDLTDAELLVAGIIATRIVKNVGVKKAVKSSRIIQVMRENHHYVLTGARVRKIINYLRNTGRVPFLVASSKGYYVSNDPEEMRKYVFSLRQRAEAIKRVADALEVQMISVSSSPLKKVS